MSASAPVPPKTAGNTANTVASSKPGDFLADLESDIQSTQRQQAATMPPEILAFARECREVFGPNVKLYPDPGHWPGGSNLKAKPGFYSRRIRKLFRW